MLLMLTCYLFLLRGSMLAFAFAGDLYNAKNYTASDDVDYDWVIVSADPDEGAYVSGGAKYKLNGNQVYISTSARNTEDYTYTFLYWTLNGVKTSYGQNFYYTPSEGKHEFVAHYEKIEVPFDPENPLDPSSSTIKREYRLYLTSNIEGACSFNMDSGNKIQETKDLYLSVNYQSAFYQFEGWKQNGQIISTEPNLHYIMPSAITTLEACFSEKSFDPDIPIDPNSEGHDVVIAGDADNNGKVDVNDVSAVAKYIMGETIEGFNKNNADFNKDNKIDVTDIVLIVKMIISAKE